MKDEHITLMPTAIEEQETTINLSYADKKAYVYTSKISVARSLADLCTQHQDETEVIRCDEGGFEAALPINWVTIRPKKKRQITEEQRRALTERLAAIRQK